MLAALVSSDEVVLVNKPGCSLCGWNWVGFKLQEKEITGVNFINVVFIFVIIKSVVI